MSSWRAVLRIARRDALQARGRSALVAAMIGLPVLGLTAVSVIASTYELSPEQSARRLLGQADAAYLDSGSQSLTADPGGGYLPGPPRTAPVDLTSLLPPGSRSTYDVVRDGTVQGGGETTRARLRELAYDDPVARGIYHQREGRAPTVATEVALTSDLAERLRVGLGDEVVLDRTGPARTVVGLVDDAGQSDARAVLLEPGVLGPPALDGFDVFGSTSARLLVDVPGELRWAQVEAAAAGGVRVEPRRPVVDAPPEPQSASDIDEEAIAAVGLVVGMALLEVVLLAGPAFAVGAKRSRRQLALLAATGADRRDVRRTVLGGGLVLGAVGGVLGLAGGTVLALAALPVIGRFDPGVPGPFDVVGWQIAGIAVVGVGTALLAALLPAHTASRQDVVAGLTGRTGTVVASGRLVPLLGLLATVAGAALALEGARSRSVLVILAGSVVAELGLVALTPTLVGAAGCLGPLLPVAPRLALRDASRNRGRTAPAVSAILAAVAGTVAVGTFLVSQDQSQRDSYTPSAVAGTAVVPLYEDADGKTEQVVAALRRELPVDEVVLARGLNGGGDGQVDLGYVELVPKGVPCGPGQGVRRECEQRGGIGLSGPLVGDARLALAATGASSSEITRVLRDGGAVVPADWLADDGRAVIAVFGPGHADGTPGARRELRVPGVELPAGAFPVPVLSEQAAERTGRELILTGAVVRTSSVPTERQQDRAYEALRELGISSTSVYVERGYDSDVGTTVLALAGVSALLVLGASGIATGLAAADGRADLSTLASVGASPGLRRRLAGAQSLVTAGLGTALGTVAGLVPAYAFIRTLNQPDETGYVRKVPFPFVLPWELLAVTAVVVPLVAALAAVLLTRSRLPLVRRIA
jgi:putative ABC transport system permease protein